MTGVRTVLDTLPNEILGEIASYLPVRHEGHTINVIHVASLSATSRRFRAVSLPHLYRDVVVTSLEQLRLLSTVLGSHLPATRLIRELNILMDEEFVDAWIIAAAADEPQHDSPFVSLTRILSTVTRLEALRIRIAEPSGARSGWRKFGIAQTGGIAFGAPLMAAFSLVNIGSRLPASIPALHTLELDGFQDVGYFLQLVPNLESLHLAISAGYSQQVNEELISSLRHVPRLRHLTYTPETLRCRADDRSGARGAGLLLGIGKLLPQLETLDLQTRNHRHSIYFCTSSEPAPLNDVLNSLKLMPALSTLALPTSIMSTKDSHILRSSLPVSRPESAIEHLPILREALRLRDAAIRKTASVETELLDAARRFSTRLTQVSFVRHAEADDTMEYAIRYLVTRRHDSPRRSPQSNISARPSDRQRRPSLLTLLKASDEPEVLTAVDAGPQLCRPLLPPSRPKSLALTLQELWSVAPGSMRLRTLTAAWAKIPVVFPAEAYSVVPAFKFDKNLAILG